MASREKSRPAAISTCSGCAASWSILGAAHCPTCHMTFVDAALFDAHRPRGACLAPGELGMQFRDNCWQKQELDDSKVRNGTPTGGQVDVRTAHVHNHVQCPEAPQEMTESPRGLRADHPSNRGGKRMAKVTEVKLLDDLDPETPAVENVEFGLDGKSYEIDLSAENAEKLREALAPFVGAARRSGVTTRRGRTTSRDRMRREESQQIREWARAREMDVSDRGRIPGHITDAYYQAMAAEGSQA